MEIHGDGGGKAGPRNADPLYFLHGVRELDRVASPESPLQYRERTAFRHRRGILTGQAPSLISTYKEG